SICMLVLMSVQLTLGVSSSGIQAQNDNSKQKKITGIVKDNTGESLPGASVKVKGTKTYTTTDANGRFSLIDVSPDNVVVISFLGMKSAEVKVGNQTMISVSLEDGSVGLDEVVAVGYGLQKKINVVGAISSIKGEALLQSGGVSSVGQALQGKIPGLVTLYTNGKPGENDMKIYLRGQSSWNNAGNTLILVDGVERNMNDIDMNEVESISVLKDASATAVYGVKGANGVVLLTTKRGQSGKAKLSVSGNVIAKTISKVPEKYDSYDAMMITNEAIMRELMYKETSWANITPVEIANKYRNQKTQLEKEMFPNVDWKDYMFKDVANDYQLNLSISGGSDFAKYFCNLSYNDEGDMTKDFETGKGYNAQLSYKRLNYRSNLDFNLTKTTKLSINLSGTYSRKTAPPAEDTRLYISLYNLAPDLFYPRYSDGSYGYTEVNDLGLSNSLYYYTTAGQNTSYGFRINTDFSLDQKLDFITKGLVFNGRFTLDNTMTGTQNISDPDNIIQKRYANDGKDIFYKYPIADNDYAYVIEPWTLGNFDVGGNKNRRLEYQLSLNYQRTFASKHNVSALLLFKRQKYTEGSAFAIRYEDIVSRLTYNYNTTYFIEANGAYNGSELFGPNYRRDLFPSIALGWVISNEPFMKGLIWLDKFKIRASAGEVGDDGFTNERWLYDSQWASSAIKAEINSPGIFGLGGQTVGTQSPYSTYVEKIIGNADVHWERSLKKDIGIELSVLKGEFTADVDYFEDNRRDIYLPGSSRAIPDWYGAATPPGGNVGAVNVKGYEIVLGYKHKFDEDLRMWADLSFTRAKDIILYKEDPYLTPSYLKKAGYAIDQTYSSIPGAMMQNWDDVYMSTPLSGGNTFKRVGYYDVVDFNGDGNFNGTYDNAPYGYPNRPENTWNLTLGTAYKAFSFTAQLYAQTNTIRNYNLSTFPLQTHLYFKDLGDYWSRENPDGKYGLIPWTLLQANNDPMKDLVDASMVRLKMVEVAYHLPKTTCKKLGITGMKLFVNGNNLLVWTKMADDRDFGSGNRGTYPTLKRFNFGFNLDL
ncbi:MAG: SusC/RagA family TonB-linked outer membrane protein, partial [Bacteroidia bacterium]|nr:SusC/RagA family TonB-linked outer membrane protein [Bacteroidia bacterium]